MGGPHARQRLLATRLRRRVSAHAVLHGFPRLSDAAGEDRRGPTPSRFRLPQRLLLASVDGCPELLSHNFPPVDGCPQLSTTSEPFQASTRGVIGIGRWVSTTFTTHNFHQLLSRSRLPQRLSLAAVGGCPQLSPFPQLPSVRWVSPTTQVDGCPQLLSPTPSLASVGGCPQLSVGGCPQLSPFPVGEDRRGPTPIRFRLPRRPSLTSVDGPQLSIASFLVFARLSSYSQVFWNRRRKLKRRNERMPELS